MPHLRVCRHAPVADDKVLIVSASHARDPWFKWERMLSSFSLKSKEYIQSDPRASPWNGAVGNWKQFNFNLLKFMYTYRNRGWQWSEGTPVATCEDLQWSG